MNKKELLQLVSIGVLTLTIGYIYYETVKDEDLVKPPKHNYWEGFLMGLLTGLKYVFNSKNP